MLVRGAAVKPCSVLTEAGSCWWPEGASGAANPASGISSRQAVAGSRQVILVLLGMTEADLVRLAVCSVLGGCQEGLPEQLSSTTPCQQQPEELWVRLWMQLCLKAAPCDWIKHGDAIPVPYIFTFWPC